MLVTLDPSHSPISWLKGVSSNRDWTEIEQRANSDRTEIVTEIEQRSSQRLNRDRHRDRCFEMCLSLTCSLRSTRSTRSIDDNVVNTWFLGNLMIWLCVCGELNRSWSITIRRYLPYDDICEPLKTFNPFLVPPPPTKVCFALERHLER